MHSPLCFALAPTSFTGCRIPRLPRTCPTAPAPYIPLFTRRARAAAEPDIPDPLPEKAVDVLDASHQLADPPALADPPTRPGSPTLSEPPARPDPPTVAPPSAPADPSADLPSPQLEDTAPATPDEPVPGKVVLTEAEIEAQRVVLQQYADELRRERLAEEREAARLFGWVRYAETLNARMAMFFFVTGMLTEYWTGYTLPEQIELMARTLGFL